MDDFIPRAEHEEFARRQDEENKRQNKRIELLEENVQKMGALTTSVEKLAANMESMLKEQEKQGERLGMLEGHDGDMWRNITSHIIMTVVGAVVCYALMRLGL